MFNDSAFGIDARVRAILAPADPISTVDYLDALCTVREKLTALYTILLEFCTHPTLIGLGVERAAEILSLKDGGAANGTGTGTGAVRRSSADPGALRDRLSSQGSLEDGSRLDDASVVSANNVAQTLNSQELLKSEVEVRQFLEDQVNQSTVAMMHTRS